MDKQIIPDNLWTFSPWTFPSAYSMCQGQMLTISLPPRYVGWWALGPLLCSFHLLTGFLSQDLHSEEKSQGCLPDLGLCAHHFLIFKFRNSVRKIFFSLLRQYKLCVLYLWWVFLMGNVTVLSFKELGPFFVTLYLLFFFTRVLLEQWAVFSSSGANVTLLPLKF